MLQLHNLKKLKKDRKRVGRGGDRGGTSGRGHKGQRARSGGLSSLKPFFEGGQMPLSRRLPKRGFTNKFKKEFLILNLRDLESRFESDSTVDKKVLREAGVIKGKKDPLVKILGSGELSKKLTVYADVFSASAKAAISKAGGSAEVIKLEKTPKSEGV